MTDIIKKTLQSDSFPVSNLDFSVYMSMCRRHTNWTSEILASETAQHPASLLVPIHGPSLKPHLEMQFTCKNQERKSPS